MKPIQIALIAAWFAASGAQAQLVAPAPGPALLAERPAALPGLPSFPVLVSESVGLPPSDPLAPYVYRTEPKVHGRIDFNPYLGLETTFTNANYVERLHYNEGGPRLATGAPLGIKGYNFDLAARLTVPVDDQLSAFGKLGVAASERQHHTGTVNELGPAAAVGATYKLKNGQTATAEIPLSPMARKALTGAAGGYGAQLKLGF